MFIKIHVLFAIYFTKVWKVKNFSATHTLQAWSNLGILDLEKNLFILTLIEYTTGTGTNEETSKLSNWLR